MINAIFIPIPRNASWSIEKAIDDMPTMVYLEEQLDELNRGWLEQRLWHRASQRWPSYWDAATSFAVLRNPWSRVVSLFHHKTLIFPEWTFSDFVQNIPSICAGKLLASHINSDGAAIVHPDRIVIQHHVFPQAMHLLSKDNKKIGIDRILRFENLQEDWDNFLKSLGLPQVELSHHNFSGDQARGKSTGIQYTDFYKDQQLIDLVGKIYRTDVKLGNYKFGQEDQ
jgi:hypothetical protein